MTMMSNLPQDLVEEILFRVPITSLRAVRSTCKGWNSLSKDERFAKKHCGKAAKENLAVLICDYRCCLMSVNLHGIHNNETMVDPFMRNIGNLLNQVLIYNVIHSDGLLLFVTRDKPNDYDARLVVWNPYLGQARWILPSHFFDIDDNFSIGYDKNNNHKILRFSIGYRFSKPYIDCEIYNLKSNSWKDLDVNCVNWRITGYFFQRGVLLKGNTYYVANGCSGNFLLGFDFTKERFGKRLHLPFNINNHNYGTVTLSSVCEEQLTALHQGWKTSEIWVTTKIDPYAVSWTKFFVLKDNMISNIASSHGRFFIDDEEKKLVVVCEKEEQTNKAAAYMIREDGYCKEVDLGESKGDPLMCSYVPSLAKIQQGSVPAGRKRKQRDCFFYK